MARECPQAQKQEILLVGIKSVGLGDTSRAMKVSATEIYQHFHFSYVETRAKILCGIYLKNTKSIGLIIIENMLMPIKIETTN